MNVDFLLIKRMKQGNEEAFDVFVHKYYEEILKYCSYHCFDRAYAEDLTQETFVRFFTKLSDYRYMGKTRNYLYTIAGNLCRDYYKKIKEAPVDEQAITEATGLAKNQEETILNKVTMEWALGQLSDELREVVVLYYFQERKLTEVAAILQIGLPLVKYRVRQAKIRLKELFGKEDLYGFGNKTYE